MVFIRSEHNKDICYKVIYGDVRNLAASEPYILLSIWNMGKKRSWPVNETFKLSTQQFRDLIARDTWYIIDILEHPIESLRDLNWSVFK